MGNRRFICLLYNDFGLDSNRYWFWVYEVNTQNNSQSNAQNISTIRIMNSTGYPCQALWIKQAGSNDWGNRHNLENGVLRNGQSSTVRFSSPINTAYRYDIALIDSDGDFYIKNNIIINGLITFTFDDFVSGN